MILITGGLNARPTRRKLKHLRAETNPACAKCMDLSHEMSLLER